jgi:hypothetical protein
MIHIQSGFLIDQYCRLVLITVEGAQNATDVEPFTERTMVAGVLMLLTAYKLFSYYNGTNRT